MDINEQAIITTLIYATIFDYPLTEEEVWQYAIAKVPLDKEKFLHVLHNHPDIETRVIASLRYYFLRGEEPLVQIRLNRESAAKKKLRIARKTAQILSHIPFIQCIGLSGSVSMTNTLDDDDIDLFIIVRQHTLWITRFCIFFLLEVLRKRRQRNARHVNNTICVNLLLEESCLRIAQKNIYIAHEVAQVKPLFDRNNTYQKFLAANLWIQKFLPNAMEHMEQTRIKAVRKETHPFVKKLNWLAKKLQLWYMKGQEQSEKISDTVLAFYHSATQERVLKMYGEGLEQYDLAS